MKTMIDYPDLCNNEPSCQKPELLNRIRELEALHLQRTKLTDRVTLERDELKAKLERVRKLPDRWRSIGFPDKVAIEDVCADELQEALADE